MANFRRRIGAPPPSGNQNLDQWLRDLHIAFNSLPHMSWFSGTTPNSTLTGTPGDLAVNLASGSTVSRLWMLTGDTSLVTTLGWRLIQLGGS